MSSLVPIVFKVEKIHVLYKDHFQKQTKRDVVTLFVSTNSYVVLKVEVFLLSDVREEV